MACVKIFTFFGLLVLGFLIPSEVAATDIGIKSSPGRDEGFLIPSEVAATDIGTKSSPDQDEALTKPVIILVTDDDQNLNQSNIRIRFDVHNDNYSEFIQTIRTALRDSDSHGIPVLAPQPAEYWPEDAAWLDIRLVAGTSSVTLRLEPSNLYVRGYRRSTEGSFWELTDTRLIPGSSDLLFSGSYREANGIVNAAGEGVTRATLALGAHQLENAIYTLDRMDTPLGHNSEAAARSLLILIQMIAEAARFRTISRYIAENYWTPGGVTLDSRMLAMQNGWGQLSTAMLQADRNPTFSTPLPNIQSINPTDVFTFGQALAVLGILVITRPSGSGGSRSTPDLGRCLMNLEYVRVNNIDGENPGHLFGSVRVNDGWFSHAFYERESGDYENVGPGGFATLIDSAILMDHSDYPISVSAMDAFTISVDLFDYDTLSPNDEIARGEIVWDRLVESVGFASYDKHLQQVVKGEYGDVTVGYSILSNAVRVIIEVMLIDGDGESTAQIYGTLRASQVLGGSVGLAPITLFDKSSGQYVQVRQRQPIPLTRSVVAASASSKFTITADLWDHDTLSPDDEIAQGSADFTLQPRWQIMQSIKGRHGEVLVVISCDWEY